MGVGHTGGEGYGVHGALQNKELQVVRSSTKAGGSSEVVPYAMLMLSIY